MSNEYVLDDAGEKWSRVTNEGFYCEHGRGEPGDPMCRQKPAQWSRVVRTKTGRANYLCAKHAPAGARTPAMILSA